MNLGNLFLVFVLLFLSNCEVFFALSSSDVLAHSAVLDPQGKYHVSWDFDEEDIYFEVQVQTLGYVGFGLSPNGDMPGSDIVIGGVYDQDGTVYFTDRHATAIQEPVIDELQDWYLVRGSQNDTHTTLRFWRPLDTCDEQDRPLQMETARVIWAYNDADADSAGKISYHGTSRGSKSIFLLNPQRTLPDIPEDSLIVDFLNDNVQVPEDDTTYWCQAFVLPELDRKHHVIKIEPVVQSGHESLVHHIVMLACYPPVSNATVGQGHTCYDGFMPEAWGACISTLFAWAVGGGPLYFPEHVGFPFGFDEDPSLILLQTHYDNPGLLKGITDSSGLRLTLSPRPRKYDAATLTVGLAVGSSHVIPPYSEKFTSAGHCVPECLTQAMENHASSINIFAGFLHAHLLAKSIRFRHYRNGTEKNIIVEDVNYDFDFQEMRMLNEEVEVLPEDLLVTECDYRTMHKEKITNGGESTSEEMCLTFALYYPRIPLTNCQTTMDHQELAAFMNFTILTIKEPEELRGRHYYSYLNSRVNWTDETERARFQDLVTTHDKSFRVECFVDMNTRYPVHWQKVKLPEVQVSLPEEQECIRREIDENVENDATATTHPLIAVALVLSISVHMLVEHFMYQ